MACAMAEYRKQERITISVFLTRGMTHVCVKLPSENIQTWITLQTITKCSDYPANLHSLNNTRIN